MRSFAPRILTLLAAAAVTLHCQAVPSPTPSAAPSPTPSPCQPPYPHEWWGSILLYETSTGCHQFATPPRIGVRSGEDVTWRIYNKCRGDHTVEIGDIRKSPDERGFADTKTFKDFDDFKLRRKEHPAADPFEPGDKKKRVSAGGIEDLKLKTKRCHPGQKDAYSVSCGIYTYVAFLDGKPDEGDIDIWP